MTAPVRESRIIVLVHEAIASQLREVPAGVIVVHYTTVDDLCQVIAEGASAFVLVSDSIADTELTRVAGAVNQSGTPCIEVRSEPWDGTTFSPLSAACRGVISGFGIAAIPHAIDVLRS